jgi:hypothetical protein
MAGHAPTATAHGTVATAHAPTAPGASRPSVRRFFCRHCRHGVDAADCPDGWLRVQLRDAPAERRTSRAWQTTALFCGLDCLARWATTTSRVTP